MKKLFVALLSVLMILAAFIVVQAQENSLDSIGTETVGKTPAIVTPVAETEDESLEKKDEKLPEKSAEDNEPEQDITVDLEVEPEDEEEPEIIEEPEEEPSNEPEDKKEQEAGSVGNPEAEEKQKSEPVIIPEVEEESKVEPINESEVEKESETPESKDSSSVELPEGEETPVPEPKPTEDVPVDEHIYDEVIVSIQGTQVSVPYDGQRHQVSGYKVLEISDPNYMESDIIFTGNAAAELYDAGIVYMGLNESQFVNRNSKYVNVYFQVEDGFIEIDPINVEIEIIGYSDSVEYDGDVHSVYGYEFKQVRPETPILVTAESFGLRDGTEPYVESSKVGVYKMGLTSASFENYDPNFNRVLFYVTDGFIEITSSEDFYQEEENEIIDETVNELNDLPEETPVEQIIAPEVIEEPVPETTVEPEATEQPVVEKTGEPEVKEETTVETTMEAVNSETEESKIEPTESAVETAGNENPMSISSEAESVDENKAEDEEKVPEEPAAETEGEEGNSAELTDTETAVDPENNETENHEDAIEPGKETDETEPGEANEQTENVTLTVGAMILAEPEETAEIILTLEEDTDFEVISVTEDGWTEIKLDEETSGFIYIVKEELPEEVLDIETEEKGEEEQQLAVAADVVIRADADGMSEIILTAGEDEVVTLLSVEGDWVKVLTKDGDTGYIFRGDVQLESVEENQAETPAVEDKHKVLIFTSRRAVMELGEEIHLTSLLEGFEDNTEIKYQWECDKGSGFEPVEGANGDTYSYPANLETLTWSWRLVVEYE